jgi:hypothetical protein
LAWMPAILNDVLRVISKFLQTTLEQSSHSSLFLFDAVSTFAVEKALLSKLRR